MKKSEQHKQVSIKESSLVNPDAAGIDVGPDQHWVCVPEDRAEKNVRSFGCSTLDLHAIADWLAQCRVTTVAMESKEVYWFSLFQVLESRGFDVKLVNDNYIKTIPGRKSDMLDCQWIQELHSYGLLTSSFRPVSLKTVEKSQNKGLMWIAWSAALLLVSAGSLLVYSWTLNRPLDPVAVKLVNVKKDTVEDKINESGTVELGNQQTLKSPADGTVEQVLVRVGQKVESGQTLVILQDPQRQTALANQQLEIQKQELKLDRSRQKVLESSQELKMAEAELEKLVTEELEIQKLELQLARNQEKVSEYNEQLQGIEREFEELEILLERGFIPENELEQKKNQVLQIQSQLRDAELAVNTTELELQRLQMALTKKQQSLSNQVIKARSQLRDYEVVLSTDLRELERLRLEQAKIEQEIQKSLVKATGEAKVLDIQVQLGDVVKLGDSLLTLGDPSEGLVKIELSPLDAVRLQVNQMARVRPIGANNQTFTGKVKNISKLAVSPSQDDNRKNSGQATVTATVKLDQPNQILIPGSKVDVEIIVAASQNVVVLSRELIQISDSEAFVWVKDAQGKAQKRSITLGLEGLTQVEVTSGLKQGDKVLVPLGDSSLQPGMPLIINGEL